MKFPLFLVFSAFIAAATAHTTQPYTFQQILPSKTLEWHPCNPGFLCAKLSVPLSYQNYSLGLASVPLLKYPATTNSSSGPYQGMLLLNPGGPGASGVEEVFTSGPLIQSIIGSNWDVVGFDPRGMWLSEPLANCSDHRDVNPVTGLKGRGVPRVSDEFYEEYIEFGREVGKECEERSGGVRDAGPHMSTATVARDLISLIDAFALTPDGKRSVKPSNLLNYYGISYGTFLGQTFASMFPSRVGNLILDGVVDPAGYLTNFTSESVNHLDELLAAFFIYCHEAGFSKCAYKTGSTPKDIFNRFNASFVQLDPRKAESEGWSNATELQDALLTLKVSLLAPAHSPFGYFPIIPQVLLDLESALQNQTLSSWTLATGAIFGSPGPANYKSPDWRLGTLCSDQNNRWYNKTLDDLRPQLKALEKQSIIGEIWSMAVLGCLGWSVEAEETFEGPFGGVTQTPILFVGNTYDGATPIEKLHTATASQNLCGFSKIAAYLQTNQLPGNDSLCQLEKGPFNILLNGTLEDNINRAGLASLF
ncbi:hypothetical protein HYFRA_00001481 [Hymenoscyphus fraxineus]|uniref:AB hydrolase-1 domain-containing protein n=1 Tax=Hymenoscyphus fraxineus TaxID=746836 RepID=A0A9N9L4Z5_9HELO|nr:hypothetical protein HYFRA_00001481 [Hymenoscyphus fraxineus]